MDFPASSMHFVIPLSYFYVGGWVGGWVGRGWLGPQMPPPPVVTSCLVFMCYSVTLKFLFEKVDPPPPL